MIEKIPPQRQRAASWICLLAASLCGGSLHGGPNRYAVPPLDFDLALKYSAMGYYMTPIASGSGEQGKSLEFDVPVNRGLDCVFIIAGGRNCRDVDLWISDEGAEKIIVKDSRKVSNGLAGVRWRSEFSGTISVIVRFTDVVGTHRWQAIVGRRAGASEQVDISSQIVTAPGSPTRIMDPPTRPHTNSKASSAPPPARATVAPNSSRGDSMVPRSFLSPVDSIYFHYDPKSNSWESGKNSIPAVITDVEPYLERLAARLKNSKLVPTDASLSVATDGIIRIERIARSRAAPVRVPDPKELGSPRSVPDPEELGSPASKAQTPGKNKIDF